MFGILTLEARKPKSFRQRLERLIFGSVIEICNDRAGKAMFAVCNVSREKDDGRRKKAIVRAFAKLKARGAFRVIVPQELRTLALDAGLMPISNGQVLRACASRCVFEALRKLGLAPKNASLLLCSEKVGRELTRAALELGMRIKYLHVESPAGGDALNKLLMRELGIADMAQGHTFDCAIAYDERCEIPQALPVINLSGCELNREDVIDFTLETNADLMAKAPQGIDKTAFVSALFLSGAAGVNDIHPQTLIKTALDM